MEITFNYAYLRGFIKEHFTTNHNFAEFLGISDTALYDRLSNKVPFSQYEIDLVATKALDRRLTMTEIDSLFFNH